MKNFLKASIYTSLALTVLTNTAYADTSVNVTPAEREKIEQVVHDYLVRKPEVLVEALQTLQRKQYEQAEQTVKKTQQIANQYANELFHQPNDPVAGNANGKVTIVEFFDYQCPHCIDMAPVMDAVIRANPNVRVIYKEFPIRGPVSDFAARAALAANKQGKYNILSHAILLAKQPLTQDAILDLAKTNGLDVEKLKKDMNDESIINQIKANIKLAQNLQLFGTPAFFIAKSDVTTSGKINYFPGQMDQKQLQSQIDEINK